MRRQNDIGTDVIHIGTDIVKHQNDIATDVMHIGTDVVRCGFGDQGM